MAFINKSNIEKIYPSKRILKNLKKNQLSTGDVAIFHNLDDSSYIGLIIRMDMIDDSKLDNTFNISSYNLSEDDGIILFPEEYSVCSWSKMSLNSFRDNLTFIGDTEYDITGIMKNVIDKDRVYDAEKVRTTINKLIKERV